MPDDKTLAEARRWFAEDLRTASPIRHNSRIADAFAKVPREHYLGPGPWTLHPRVEGVDAYLAPSANPRHLYHDVLVTIDAARGLNNGQPSLWAYVFDNLDLAEGASVLQVGAGVGYFTAILAEIVGPRGSVLAFEADDELAARAKANLIDYTQVDVVASSATAADDLPTLGSIVACAGATHPPEHWLRQLSDGGRMMLPLTAADHRGFMMLVRRDGDRFHVSSLGPCGFYHCVGARRDDEAAALAKALRDDRIPPLDQLHLGSPTGDPSLVWYSCHNAWISRR